MARRRPNAFEVSFPDESVSHEATSLRSEASSSTSLKRKGDGPIDTREPKRRQLPPPAFYEERDGELETENLVIVGEDPFAREDVDGPGVDATKPVRVLSDFAIYDPKHGNEMVLLSSIEEDDGVDRLFEAEGIVSPYYLNEEDEGQEDGDNNDVPQVVRLGAILRYTLDYTEADGKVYIETLYAWYILDTPTRTYEPLFKHFFTPLRIAQMVISTSLNSPRITYEDFLTRFSTKVDPFGTTYQEAHLLEAISNIQDAVNESDEYEMLKTVPLIQRIFRKATNTTTAPAHRRPRRQNAPTTRGKPPPIRALTRNLDIALLDRENAVPTHVTPFIASLARGLVTEELVVVGVRPPPENKGVKERQRNKMHERLCELILRAKVEKIRVERMGRDSRYPVAMKINGEIFQNGDFVLVPIHNYTDTGRNYKPSEFLPDNIEDVDETSTIADYFWFARIVFCSMNPAPGYFHVHWLQHSTQTTVAERGHPQELFWNDICGNIPWGAVSGKIKVHETSEAPDQFDEYFVKFVYNLNEATYTSIDQEIRKLVARSQPPFNCTICPLVEQHRQEEEEMKLRDQKGNTIGVAFRGQKYHYEDFVLYQAQEGPAHIGYITEFRLISNTKVKSQVSLRKVGRISGLGDILPRDVLRDERQVFLTDVEATVPLEDLIRVCHVLHPKSFQSSEQLKVWLDLSPDHFFVTYSFPSLKVTSWKQLQRIRVEQFCICSPCTNASLEEYYKMEKFLEDAKRHPLRTLDLFGGVGAFSMGLGQGSKCLKFDQLVELAPSAAKTVMRNFPNVAVHNRCANDVLRYSIKEKLGHKPEPLRQHYDESVTLPSLEKPDVIVAGVPCQTHSTLNRFKRADDKKSNLILTALSYVDHLRPKLFYFENVPGFKEFTFDAAQAAGHTLVGGTPMGGLKFVIRALTEMQYQVRFAVLQAGHYGAPQRRHRFFLIAAEHGHPLPELPQPSHDFPDNYGLKMKLELRSSQKDIQPIRARNGTAPHPFVSIDDAISDLPRFDWKVKSSNTTRRGIPAKTCDPSESHCGYSGVVEYHHEMKTSYQATARVKATKNLQHFTRTFKPEKVKRVMSIPLEADADYRQLPPNLVEWQIANPLSSVAKNKFRPGIYGRLNAQRFFPTTVTNMDTTAKQSHVLNPYCHRMVTVRELARSQGFPDHFVFEASDNGVVTMHRQIGNAVPLPVGVALGRELRKARFKHWLVNRQDNGMTVDSD